MHNVVRDYDKNGKRNRKKDDNHLNKHAMHLIRLFMMAIDILEKEDIITYRKDEHELLMKIRRGEFQKEDGNYRTEFYEIQTMKSGCMRLLRTHHFRKNRIMSVCRSLS